MQQQHSGSPLNSRVMAAGSKYPQLHLLKSFLEFLVQVLFFKHVTARRIATRGGWMHFKRYVNIL